MKYTRFEELLVWHAGMELAEKVFRLTEHKSFSYKGDLRSQLQRAALSICNNVAGGFERGTTPELLTFLYIAARFSRRSAFDADLVRAPSILRRSQI
ncbi:MAG TPA: four helix bundle protein [Verrucomicrobiae bacterium]|nr:four helix bundle protein [Verrucomicrobiae bacterium]